MVFGETELKQGFAFVRVADGESRDRALNELDKTQFSGRQISIQRARGDGSVKQREAERRKNQVQTETVFIVNFEIGMFGVCDCLLCVCCHLECDVNEGSVLTQKMVFVCVSVCRRVSGRTTEDDVRIWCAPFGQVRALEMHDRFAFVQFGSIQEAVDAQRSLDGTEVRILPFSFLPPSLPLHQHLYITT